MLKSLVLKPVVGLPAWRGSEIAKETDWIHLLSADELAELEAVGRRFLDEDPDLRTVRAEDYPLPVTTAAIGLWTEAMEHGRGFVLVRGLRTHQYSDALSASIFFLIGLHMGQPMRQTELGDMVQHVLATSDKTMNDPGTTIGSRERHEAGRPVAGGAGLRERGTAPAPPSAAANSWADPKRSAGSFSRAVRTACSTSGGMDRRRTTRGRGSSVRT